ncbi:hypothetical protein [Candidatus Cardinium hertigii]|jgi:hypothetical protein|uniref:Uncharacterized protein n=1 Tax=Candidatus Cardinium hertigii TaxID=247481 RepID=A0A3N2QBR0_9BACT|nr:hypothetical protein [Candidatus Cardinium hertigii]ROT47253.1 hypothetical protein EDM02_03830 [Candidatus Cardinium hertigii]
MRIVLNGLLGLHCYAAFILLLYTAIYAGSCKNAAASREIGTTFKNKKGDSQHPNDQKEDQEDVTNELLSENHTYEILKDNLEKKHKPHVKPSFTLKDLTIESGTVQSMTLSVAGMAEDYIVKSVSITKNATTSYVKQFGLNNIKNQPVPSSGLTFTLIANQNLKPGAYLLTLTLGKVGVGSKATVQLVSCTITIPNNHDCKTDATVPQPKSSPPTLQHCSTQTIEPEISINNEVIKDHKEEKEPIIDPAIPTQNSNPIESTMALTQPTDKCHAPLCHFFKEDEPNININAVCIKIGESITIPYYIEDNQMDYKIKSVQIIKQGNQKSSYKQAFGLDHLKETTFSKCIHLCPKIKTAGIFLLIIKIQRPGKQPLLVSKCNITVCK